MAKYDLKQITFIATTTATNFGITTGPEGTPPNMNRYVVYANYYNPAAASTIITLWERIATTDRRMDVLGLTQYTERRRPEGGNPDAENPVYVFRASSFIRAQTSGGNILVTMQVYDQPG